MQGSRPPVTRALQPIRTSQIFLSCFRRKLKHSKGTNERWISNNTIQYHTTLLSLCRQICRLARHLHKTFSTLYKKSIKKNPKINIKSTISSNVELKTAQIPKKKSKNKQTKTKNNNNNKYQQQQQQHQQIQISLMTKNISCNQTMQSTII